jgi:hypothetical protein
VDAVPKGWLGLIKTNNRFLWCVEPGSAEGLVFFDTPVWRFLTFWLLILFIIFVDIFRLCQFFAFCFGFFFFFESFFWPGWDLGFPSVWKLIWGVADEMESTSMLKRFGSTRVGEVIFGIKKGKCVWLVCWSADKCDQDGLWQVTGRLATIQGMWRVCLTLDAFGGSGGKSADPSFEWDLLHLGCRPHLASPLEMLLVLFSWKQGQPPSPSLHFLSWNPNTALYVYRFCFINLRDTFCVLLTFHNMGNTPLQGWSSCFHAKFWPTGPSHTAFWLPC